MTLGAFKSTFREYLAAAEGTPLLADMCVLAVATKPSNTDQYVVVQDGITSVEAKFEVESDERQYVRDGTTTVKSAVQRSFHISGDRVIGDQFQEWVLANVRRFGTNSAQLETSYVYQQAGTTHGEAGKVLVIVNSDGSGDAGSTAEIDIDLKVVKVDYTDRNFLNLT